MQHGNIWSVTLNVVLLYFINKNPMQQSPHSVEVGQGTCRTLWLSNPVHNFDESHCATIFISHFVFILSHYSFIVFCCGSLFSKEQANSLCIVASLGQPCSLRHFADESYKIRHIWPYFSVRIIYKDIWRCVHQHYNDCDIDEEDNCRLVIFSGALIDECEKEKHSILLFLHIQPLGLLSHCIFV